MKLWLISQSINNNWDTFDSAVVAAETEEEARQTYPNHYAGVADRFWDGSTWLSRGDNGTVHNLGYSCWTSPDNVSVQFLADGYEGPAGTVCASFNAG